MPGWTSLTTLTQDKDDTNQAVYTTASVSPSANKIVYLAFARNLSTVLNTAPVVAGAGLTWILEEYVSASNSDSPPNQRQQHNDLHVLYLYKASSGPTPGSGAITITFPVNAFNCAWAVWEVGGVGLGVVQKVRLNNGSELGPGTFVNTLGAFSSSQNGVMSIFGGMGATLGTNCGAGSGFTEIAKQVLNASPGSDGCIGLLVEGKTSNDTSVDTTWSAILQFNCGIAWELDFNPDDPTHLRYFGGGHMLYINHDTVPKISSDYGVTWSDGAQPTGGVGSYDRCKVVAQDSAAERIWSIWTNTDAGGGIAICYSLNFGANWIVSEEISGATTFATDVACHPADTGRIAVVGAIAGDANVWVSVDRGANWTSRAGPAIGNAIGYQPLTTGASAYIVWTPYGRLIICTGGRLATADGDLYYSDDLGVGWTKSTVPSPAPNRNWGVQLYRVGGFGPYFMLYGDEATGAAASALLRSDNHGVSWVSVLTPTTTELFAGLEYDPVNDTLLLSTPTHVYGLNPAASDDVNNWGDMTANFYTIALSGEYVFQPFTFVGDPAAA